MNLGLVWKWGGVLEGLLKFAALAAMPKPVNKIGELYLESETDIILFYRDAFKFLGNSFVILGFLRMSECHCALVALSSAMTITLAQLLHAASTSCLFPFIVLEDHGQAATESS